MKNLFAVGLALILLPLNARAVTFPTVYLEHIVSVIPDDVWQDLKSSTFIPKEFATAFAETENTSSGSWTGYYLFGQTHYIELFSDKNPMQGAPNERTEVNFGVNHDGDLNTLAALLKEDSDPLNFETSTLSTPDGTPILHGLALDPAVPIPSFNSSVLQYDLNLLNSLKRPCLDSSSPCTDVSAERADYPQYRPDLPFTDISSITLALDQSSSDFFATITGHLGYSSQVKNGEIDYQGPDVLYKVVPADAHKNGVLRIDLILKHPITAGPKIYPLGSSGALSISADASSAAFCFQLRSLRDCSVQ
jgi:hypothetical protein